jgi:phospholipid/cholesterol/gamma-HCH transport system substrate-binding protein
MKTAIRKHWKDFAAIVVLLVIAIGVSSVILSKERLTLPGWVPLIGKDFFEFNGAFSTVQAVTPGQGQTVDVAGVKVGEIHRVDLEDGRAVLGLRISDTKLRVYNDASMLLRPKTGLRDMVVELNPGHPQAGRLKEGATVPISQTLPDVNLDEILAALDQDTRDYLVSLVQNGATGLRGRAGDLDRTIRAFKPTAHALRRINVELAQRRTNIKRVIHNFSLVAGELGTRDDQIARFVDDSNAVFSVLARQEAAIRATVSGLPSTLTTTRTALEKTDTLASQLGPTLQALRPAARELGPALTQIRPFLRQTTPVIRDQIRPLVRATNPLVTQLRPTLRDLSAATPNLVVSLQVVNRLLDMLAYNPPGQEEGYLFWNSWVNHLGASLFSLQDAHGPIRRGLLLVSCNALNVLDNVAQVNPVLATIISLVDLPRSSAVCPSGGGGG